jgi:hypothetical protein
MSDAPHPGADNATLACALEEGTVEPRAPWDTSGVGNIEDAVEAAKRYAKLGEESAEAKAARNDAIRRLKAEDGMSGPQIAELLDMDKRAVQWVLSGTRRSSRP